MKGKNGKRALSVLESHIDNTLPLLGLIAAGKPLERFNIADHINVPSKYIDPNNFALRVNGDSMKDDGVLHDDIIIVKKSNNASNGKTIVAYINNEATLKKYYLVVIRCLPLVVGVYLKAPQQKCTNRYRK